jgi:hypothetical protein
MFGSKKQVADSLPVTVQVIRSTAAFEAAQKLWSVNARTILSDPQSGKQVLHFALVNPHTVMWLQRDAGREDEFELIISWQEDKNLLADIHIILPGPEQAGDDSYVHKVLDGLLTTAATVPFKQTETK